MNTLSVEALEIWRGERQLCRNLSFELGEGEALRLAGANGAGKTSLMRVLAGLASPETGQVRWNGRQLADSTEFRRALAYLGHANGLKSNLSPSENLAAQTAMSQPASPPAIHAALGRLGLEACMHQPCGSLSMGQQRRTALARLLLADAALWLLDEPLTALDAAGAAVLTSLLHEHLTHGGLVVFATHQSLETGTPRVREIMLGAAA
ncbi:MAG TPA: cytochrome c biogenesis heme-transporting ATPase CcmA [Gammaproteobacteria bacterium]|nr:cytochrome c biogenesis heme-transporting ATPase CcmA [Gammaproteobacteria bacterium]